MFDAPRKDEFTQGSVFSCSYAEDYPETSAYGLVITARCDAVQDKAPIFSYIPVVPLEDWILCDGANIAMDRIHADCLNTLRNHLKDASLSDSLLETKTVHEIYESHFKPKENDRAWSTRCIKIRGSIDTYVRNLQLRAPSSSREERRLHLVANASKIDAVVKELSGNRLNGFYLLRDMPLLSGTTANCVALLREIHHIPTKLARDIVGGLTREEWDARSESSLRCPRFIASDDLAAPIAKLKSPWIEHVMQNFTMLFARIGVNDNDFAEIKESLSIIGLG
ncbi:hypothetical protein [Bordetella flabilis]|uniref:Uncharacterized protein n=1 Tax=Bordetella flabilis TaxID=463014 RepID=A0A193GJ70_9BORD|nr:hypothetical protein [Bordetella flabilis]ANN79633.1 hypothetical protein BAU07_23195 [Bordetella flabilis]